MTTSFTNVFKKRYTIPRMKDTIYELTLNNTKNVHSFIKRYRTNLTSFIKYRRDNFSKEISHEFNEIITNYITQSLNVKFLKHAVNLIKFDLKNDWYEELIEQNVYPSNIGVVCEALCDDKNLYLLENSKNKLKTLGNILTHTIAYTFAIAFGGNEALNDFEKILNNEKIFEYFKKLNKKTYQEFGNFQENAKEVIQTDPNHYIGEFEIDFITNKNYLIDVKSSKKDFETSWIRQLFTYALCIKKYKNIEIKRIVVLNPITNKNWFLDLEEFLDYDLWLKWCDKNFII